MDLNTMLALYADHALSIMAYGSIFGVGLSYIGFIMWLKNID